MNARFVIPVMGLRVPNFLLADNIGIAFGVLGGRPAVFIMLNPSTADESDNDPTVERCERRARSMGFAGRMPE